MCNCNQSRISYSSGNERLSRGTVMVKRTTNTPIVIRGDITGRRYVFKKNGDINWIDSRDVMGMDETEGLQIFH